MNELQARTSGYLLNLVRCDNGSASNAISAKIFKPLGANIQNPKTVNKITNICSAIDYSGGKGVLEIDFV